VSWLLRARRGRARHRTAEVRGKPRLARRRSRRRWAWQHRTSPAGRALLSATRRAITERGDFDTDRPDVWHAVFADGSVGSICPRPRIFFRV